MLCSVCCVLHEFSRKTEQLEKWFVSAAKWFMQHQNTLGLWKDGSSFHLLLRDSEEILSLESQGWGALLSESFMPNFLSRESQCRRCCHIYQVYISMSAFSAGRILPWGSQPTRSFHLSTLMCFAEIEHVSLENTGNV